MRRFALPMAVVSACLIMLLVYFGLKSQSYEESRYDEAIAFVWRVKLHNSEVYEHLFKVRSGINKDYDELLSAVSRLLNDAQVLADKESDLLKPDNPQFAYKAEEFLQAATKRAEMVERFKASHIEFKRSLSYFYSLSKVADIQHDSAVGNKMAEVDRKVLLYITTENSMVPQDVKMEMLSDARAAIKEAERIIQTRKAADDLHLFLSHASKLLDSSSVMNVITSASNAIPIEYFIEEILIEYKKYNDVLVQSRKKYQTIILFVSLCFVLLFIYFIFIISRYAVELFYEKARSTAILSSIHDGVIVTDENGIVEFINPTAESLTESRKDKVVGKSITNIFSLVNEKTGVPIDCCVDTCLKNGEVKQQDDHAVLVTASNKYLAIKYSVAPIHDQHRHISGAVLVFEDVTVSRRMARELEWAATHDPLTGLVNRREFGNRIVEALITAQLDKQNHALLFMDLDKFKTVNDSCGHAAGDALLRQVVENISNILRSSDTFARIGGDEFAVLLTYCPLVNAVQVANKILTAVKELSFEWDRQIFSIGVSIGVTAIDEYSQSDSSVMNIADDACYMAKNDGRNCVRVIELKKGVVRKRRTGEEVLKAGLETR